MHRTIQRIRHTYQKHKRTIHSLIMVKVLIVTMIIMTTQAQRQSRAQSVSTALGISIVNSYSGSIHLITDTMIYSGGYWYYSGDIIDIEHSVSTGSVQLGISGDSITSGIIGPLSYPGSGISSIILSTNTGVIHIQTRMIKDNREFVLGPSFYLIKQNPGQSSSQQPNINTPIRSSAGGGGARRLRDSNNIGSIGSFRGSFGSVMNTTGLNYWSDCIEEELNKNIPYKICLLEQSSAFKKNILKPNLTNNRNTKDRIWSVNELYAQISYQDRFIQKHTRFRKAVQRITKNRNNSIVNRSMLNLQQAVQDISTERLSRISISKEQLIREINYIIFKKD